MNHASEELMLKIRASGFAIGGVSAQNESGAIGAGGKAIFAEAVIG